MCIYIYICIYVYIYIYIYTYMHTIINMKMLLAHVIGEVHKVDRFCYHYSRVIYLSLSLSIHIYLYTCIHVRVYVCIIYVYVYIYIYIYIYIYMSSGRRPKFIASIAINHIHVFVVVSFGGARVYLSIISTTISQPNSICSIFRYSMYMSKTWRSIWDLPMVALLVYRYSSNAASFVLCKWSWTTLPEVRGCKAAALCAVNVGRDILCTTTPWIPFRRLHNVLELRPQLLYTSLSGWWWCMKSL